MSNVKPRKGEGRIAFIAHRERFKEMLDAGYPMKTIYEENKDILRFGYPQFTKYVARFIEAEEHQKGDEVVRQSTASNSAPAEKPTEQKTGRDPKKGFSHDPNSGNARNDLI